jgi:hypothetical protein
MQSATVGPGPRSIRSVKRWRCVTVGQLASSPPSYVLWSRTQSWHHHYPSFPSTRTNSTSHSSSCRPRTSSDTSFVACSSPPWRRTPCPHPPRHLHPRVPACARSRPIGILIRRWPKVAGSTGRYLRSSRLNSGIARSSIMCGFYSLFCPPFFFGWIGRLTEERRRCVVLGCFVEIRARVWRHYYQRQDRQA